METRSARIGSLSGMGGVVASVAGLLICGLWASGATTASAQSVRSTVEQRMQAGTAAVESAADAASQETPQAPSSSPSSEQASEPPTEQPAEQPAASVQPPPAEQPPSMTTGEAAQPEAASQPETTSQPEPPAATPAPQEPAERSQNAPAAPSAPPAAPAAEVAQTEQPSAPPTYTVKPGDTLWSISSQHLSDPFNWPKLWNVNPAVANPDLIYPGNVLTLPNGKPVEAVQTPAPPVAEAPPAEKAPEETAAAQEEAPPAAPPAEEETPPPPPEQQPIIAEQGLKEQEAPNFEVQVPPPTQSKEILAQSSGFIAKDLPVTARVVGTYENRVLLGDHDTIYLLASPGATLEDKGRYTIYRRIKRVVHPVSGRVVGDLIQILGEVEVREVGSVSTGMVVKSFAAIEPGDDVMPARTVEAAPTTPVVEGAGGSLSGLVLEVLGQQYLAGQFNIVYIDRGESSGVVVGDRFRIFKQGQRSPSYAPVANVQLPDRLIGELEVLSVQGETATALLTHTTESVALGDRIAR